MIFLTLEIQTFFLFPCQSPTKIWWFCWSRIQN